VGLCLQALVACALGPPPATQNAIWWQRIWGTVETSPKIVEDGQLLDVKAVLYNGGVGEPQWMCTEWGWIASGTSEVSIEIPKDFEVIEYTTSAPGQTKVTVSRSAITWRAVPESPPSLGTITDTCSCSISYWGAGGNCKSREVYPENFFPKGTTFHAILRARGKGCSWQLLHATYGGNLGALGWSMAATDYYAVKGEVELCELGITLSTSSASLPEDGKSAKASLHDDWKSTLTATVFDIETRDPVVGQMVVFSILSGSAMLNPASGISDTNGLVETELHSAGWAGEVEIKAMIPAGRAATNSVTFTVAIPEPIAEESVFGEWQDIPYAFEPVHPAIGNFVFGKTLFELHSLVLPVAFRVTCNSKDADYWGPLGPGWSHSYDLFLRESGGRITVKWGDGHEEYFASNGGGEWRPVACQTLHRLAAATGGGWEVIAPQGIRHLFDTNGSLASIQDRTGNALQFTHETSAVSGRPRLAEVTDTAGRQVAFHYATNADRLIGISTPLRTGGDTISFAYGDNGDLAAITDARRNTLGFTYDSSHRILTHTDARGHIVVRNHYDDQNRVQWQENAEGGRGEITYALEPDGGMAVTIAPPSGHAAQHRYDAAFNITEVIDGNGGTASFGYSSSGLRLGQRNKTGQVSMQTRDERGNPNLIQDALGHRIEVDYGVQNLPDRIVNPEGGVATIARDGQGNWIQRTNPKGYSVAAERNAQGLITRLTNERGRSWIRTYNSQNLLASETDPYGRTTAYEYDSAGRMTLCRWPNGATEQMTWDEHGNLLARQNAIGQRTENIYDANDNLIQQTVKPAGSVRPEEWAVTTFVYDSQNRLERKVDAEGGATVYTYDADSNLRTVTDPDGGATTFEYDAANRLVRRVDPLGRADHFGRDANGNLIAFTNRLGKTWLYERDAKGRMRATVTPAGARSAADYDALDQQVSFTDGEGRTTAFEHDAIGRLARTVTPDGAILRQFYDTSGSLIRRIDGSGRTWRFTYGDINELKSVIDPLGRAESFQYDSMNRLVRRIDRDGNTFDIARNAAGSITNVTVNGDSATAVSFEYDGLGNMTRTASAAGTTRIAYDRLGRRTSYTDAQGRRMTFTYTPASRLDRTVYPGNVWVEIDRNAAGMATAIRDSFGHATALHPDALGRRARIEFPNQTWTENRWDDNGWLAMVSHGRTGVADPFWQTVITRNQAGEIVQRAGLPNTTPWLGPQSKRITHDAAGQIQSVNREGVITVHTNDARGNLVAKVSPSQTALRTFDAWNRLVRSEDGTNVVVNTYDALGSRVSRVQDGQEKQYLRDEAAIYAECDASGAITRYMVGGSSLLYSLTPSGEVRVYHGDERGSVSAISEGAGVVAASYAYSSYGEELAWAGSPAQALAMRSAAAASSGPAPNDYRFLGMNGAVSDESGLVNTSGNGFFDTADGRFTSPAALSSGGDENLYELNGGDPVNLAGPYGPGPNRMSDPNAPVMHAIPEPTVNPLALSASGNGWAAAVWKHDRSLGDNLEGPRDKHSNKGPLLAQNPPPTKRRVVVHGEKGLEVFDVAFDIVRQESVAQHGNKDIRDCNATYADMDKVLTSDDYDLPIPADYDYIEIGIGSGEAYTFGNGITTFTPSHRAFAVVKKNATGIYGPEDIVAVYDPIATGTLGMPSTQGKYRDFGSVWHQSKYTYSEWVDWNSYVWGENIGRLDQGVNAYWGSTETASPPPPSGSSVNRTPLMIQSVQN